MATPADPEAAEEPVPGGGERVLFLDGGGRPASWEGAEIAVIREFDDQGRMISLVTERLR